MRKTAFGGRRVGEAYEVLHNPEKRAKYDRFGQYWKEQSQGGPQTEKGPYRGFEEKTPHGFEDFINSIFGQGHGQYQNPIYEQGRDIYASLSISLEDSFFGAEKTLQLQTPVVDGQGRVKHQSRAVKVKIPKGIGAKQQIRLKGQGIQGAHQQAGDLYIEININPHPLFELQKNDIYLRVPITPWEAALGATIQVPTLAGPVNLKIPSLSQNGKQMRLKGRGLSSHPAGDQYITLEIVIPPIDNPQAKALYEQLAQTLQYNPREKLGVGQ
jgi:curved DNA-binding protein